MKHFPGKDYNNILWTYHRPVRQCRIFKKLLDLGTLCSWKEIIWKKRFTNISFPFQTKQITKKIPLQPPFFLGQVDYPVGESADKSSTNKTINWDQQYMWPQLSKNRQLLAQRHSIVVVVICCFFFSFCLNLLPSNRGVSYIDVSFYQFGTKLLSI